MLNTVLYALLTLLEYSWIIVLDILVIQMIRLYYSNKKERHNMIKDLNKEDVELLLLSAGLQSIDEPLNNFLSEEQLQRLDNLTKEVEKSIARNDVIDISDFLIEIFAGL